jgi:hypothetical protein
MPTNSLASAATAAPRTRSTIARPFAACSEPVPGLDPVVCANARFRSGDSNVEVSLHAIDLARDPYFLPAFRWLLTVL